jgi:dihydrodipicolinate synthase/N-acetylneuraminate lyase
MNLKEPNRSFDGPFFAIVTPFGSNHEIDYDALAVYLRFLEECGVKCIVTNGTTGEFASLSYEERRDVLESAREFFSGRIVNHISSCSIAECRSLLDHSVAYADAVLLLPPFYYADPDTKGITQFFETVISDSKIDIYLYNFPKHTKINITPELFSTLAVQFPNLRGIKDSGGALEMSLRFKHVAPDREVFVGGDTLALQVLRLGLNGSVTGAGNPVPEALVGLHSAFLACDEKKAVKYQQVFDEWTEHRRQIGISEVAIVKAGLGVRIAGFPKYCRPPFTTIEEAAFTATERMLKQYLPKLAIQM